MRVYILIFISLYIFFLLPVFAQRIIRQTTGNEKTIKEANKIHKNCFDPNIEAGFCVELKKCPLLLNRLKKTPNDKKFIQFLKESNEICDKVYSHVCCPLINEKENRNKREILQLHNHLPTITESCGRTNKKPGEIGSQPWIALLAYNISGEIRFSCDGTLITSNHILTAANCIRKDLKFVRLGEHNFEIDTETQHIDIPVKKAIIHPQYSRRTHLNNIAIIYLDDSVTFTEFIRPICLPKTDPVKSKSYIGNMLFVSGWGAKEIGGVGLSELQEVQLLLHNNNVCIEAYRDIIRDLSDDQYGENVLCAGVTKDHEKDTCAGFSGAPLMISENIDDIDYFFELGITSYGASCGRAKYPGVYTNIKYYLDWIEEKINEKV